jgi:hypothetical protein
MGIGSADRVKPTAPVLHTRQIPGTEVMTMRRLFMAGIMLAALGCGGSDSDPMGPDDNGDPGSLPVGSMTARIDGAQWSNSIAPAVAYTGSILAIAASNPSLTTLGFAVIATAPGTYPIGPSEPTNALLTIGASGQTWHSSAGGGSGSITITTLTPGSAAGTFQFTMVADPASGSSGTRTITNGAFNVVF